MFVDYLEHGTVNDNFKRNQITWLCHFSPDKTHLLTFIEQFPNHFSFFLPTVKTTTERMYTCLSDHNIILMQEQNFTPQHRSSQYIRVFYVLTDLSGKAKLSKQIPLEFLGFTAYNEQPWPFL